MSVAIFGSCVSRDLFEDPVLRPTLGHYAARSSIVSVVAPPVPIADEQVQLPSPWQRSCVLGDFRKTFWAELEARRPTALVIDLIDERFGLLRIGDAYVTPSSAFRAAGLEDAGHWEAVRVSRMSDLGLRLFAEAAERFAQRVTEIVPAERVIVHRALWCTSCREGDAVHELPAEQREACARNNAMLEHGYDALEHAFGGRAATIGVDLTRHVADAGHKWGLEPYHYDLAYHREAIGQLQALLGLGAAAQAA